MSRFGDGSGRARDGGSARRRIGHMGHIRPIERKSLKLSSPFAFNRRYAATPPRRHSPRSSGKQNGGNRPKQDFKVKPDRPVVDVFEIELHPCFELFHFVPSTDLP